MKKWILAAAAMLSALPAFAGETTLVEWKYYFPETNKNFNTELKTVNDGPVYADTVRIVVTGEHQSYCAPNLSLQTVYFTTPSSTRLQEAVAVPGASGVYTIPGGRIYAMKIDFYLAQYRKVDCGLKVYAVDRTDYVDDTVRDRLLAKWDYNFPQTNRDFKTDLQLVKHGPVSVDKVKVYVSGTHAEYCRQKMTINEILYTTPNSTRERTASSGKNGVFGIPAGEMYAAKVLFHLDKWYNVDCSLELWSVK